MRRLSTSLWALLAVSISGTAAITDFSFYPLAAQDCLYKASNSSNCPETSVAETNKCLCSNGGSFVTNAAKCLGTSDPGDVSSVYKTMNTACSDSKTPLSVSEQQFLSAASTKTSTTSSASKTSTKTSSKTSTKTSTKTSSSTGSSSTSETASTTEAAPTPTGSKDASNQNGENKGMSTGAMAGIIAGGVVAGLAILAAAIVLLLRRKRRKDGEESHPMLSQSHQPSTQNFYPTPGQTVGVGHDMGNSAAGGWPDDAKWRPAASPDPRNSTFNWETPYDPANAGSPPIKQGFPTPPPPLQQAFSTPPHQQRFSTPPPQQAFSASPPPVQQGFPTQQYNAHQPPPLSPQPVVSQAPVFELVGSNQLPAEAPGSTVPGSSVVEMEGTPVPQQGGFESRPDPRYPSQYGGGGYR